jgi:hypothetical protein
MAKIICFRLIPALSRVCQHLYLFNKKRVKNNSHSLKTNTMKINPYRIATKIMLFLLVSTKCKNYFYDILSTSRLMSLEL